METSETFHISNPVSPFAERGGPIIFEDGPDSVPTGFVSVDPWGLVLPDSQATQIFNRLERVDHYLRMFREAHCFLLSEPRDLNFYFGCLIQAGRIPNRAEFFTEREEFEQALRLMTPTGIPNSDPHEIAFDLPKGLVSSRPHRFAIAAERTKPLTLGKEVISSFIIPEPALSCVTVYLKTVSATSLIRVDVICNGVTESTSIELGNWEAGWKSVKLPAAVRRSPGETFSLKISLDAGMAEYGVSNISNNFLVQLPESEQLPNARTDVIAIQFVPGKERRLERFLFLSRRAMALVKKGDWRRFWFALKRSLIR